MKLKYIYIITCCVAFLLTACEEESERVVYPYSKPEISNISYSATDNVHFNDSIHFSINVSDAETPLSTLEISLKLGEEELYKESIRTKGNAAQIKEKGIYIPFYGGLEEGEGSLTLTSVNVEGSETTVTKTFSIKRPTIPSTLYLHYNDEVIPLVQNPLNLYEFSSEKGVYPDAFSGRISTSASLEDSELIWGYFENTNSAALSTATGPEFSFDRSGLTIERIKFNTFSFTLGYESPKFVFKVNGTALNQVSNYYYADINFTKGQEVTVSGFSDIAAAYNRDFFDYDESTGKLTFIRDSGSWGIYYSMNYNYMWVARMNDVAPAAYWLVGHGFTCAPTWNNDYASGGWVTDNILKMAYVLKIAENKYQTTVYLSDAHEWGFFEVEIYSDREWGKEKGMSLKAGSFAGDVTGFTVSASNGFAGTNGFVPGYYRLTFDTSAGVGAEKMNIERLGD